MSLSGRCGSVPGWPRYERRRIRCRRGSPRGSIPRRSELGDSIKLLLHLYGLGTNMLIRTSARKRRRGFELREDVSSYN